MKRKRFERLTLRNPKEPFSELLLESHALPLRQRSTNRHVKSARAGLLCECFLTGPSPWHFSAGRFRPRHSPVAPGISRVKRQATGDAGNRNDCTAYYNTARERERSSRRTTRTLAAIRHAIKCVKVARVLAHSVKVTVLLPQQVRRSVEFYHFSTLEH